MWKIHFVFSLSLTIIIISSIVSQFYFNRQIEMDTIHKVRENIKNYYKFRELSSEEKRAVLEDGEPLFDKFQHHKREAIFGFMKSEDSEKDNFKRDREFHEHTPPRFRDDFQRDGNFRRGRFGPPEIEKEIYLFNNGLFYVVEKRVFDSGKSLKRTFLPISIGLSFSLLLISLYYLILRSLKPLKTLEESIKKFGEGELDITLNIDSNDEIGRISKEFENAVKKIGNLERSRDLFLRNIIHELKTPITKGKLVVALLEGEKSVDILNRVFNRLDSLINEMANIERITSQSGELNFATYKISEILNEAIKLGFLQKDAIDIKDFQDLSLSADLQLLSITFKNLLDNGIRYSKDKRVEFSFRDGEILFISDGEKLKKDFIEYLKPFSHSQITSKRGFGLGLYIANEIILRHKFHLHYRYSNGKNIFSIKI